MSDDIKDFNETTTEAHSSYQPGDAKTETAKHQLTGMYQNWFLDYASYVILERAVPHLVDGLKPVQRRILHTMKTLDDGRYSKVANIVGQAMQYHPHGDASISDALVQLGQKDYLIDTQGNWGNSYLHGEDFHLYPDFLTGGSIDVSRYNDGLRGGVVKVRATIEKLDNKTLVIREIPYGKTTSTVIDSILRANEKGKIKIRKVEDNTAAHAEILVHLSPGTSSDKAIDALYAFTDCEVNISPNCCVIDDKKPKFLTVSDVLRRSVDNTRELLRRELLIRRGELFESLHFASLERIFIEERIYKDKGFEQAPNMDAACEHIDKRLTPYYPQFVREVTKDDILRLMDIKMARILKFNKDKADELIARMKDEIARIDADLNNMTEVTVNWFRLLHEKYAHEHPRRTEIRSFDTIEATKVIEANEKLFINRADGFMGTGLKKDEFVDNCSPIDDVIIFYRDGTYKVTRVQEKVFIGETERSKAEKRKAEVIHIAVFKKNDKRTIYNVVYRDGKAGACYIKRFNVTSITHDREYDLTTSEAGSRVLYFTANPNGEAEVVKVTLRPNPKLRRIFFEKDFGEILVKGRQSRGNLLTRLDVHKVTLKAHGASTLGGRKVWFDADVQRLNYDERGQYLGEFHSDDLVLVVLKNGDFYTTNFDLNNHYEPTGILRVEKFDEEKVWTAVLFDADQQGFAYVKRFTLERTAQTRHLNFLGENPNSQFVLLTDTVYPRLKVVYGGADAFRDALEVDVESYIGVKSFKAKGKRLTTCAVDHIEELEPLRLPEPEPQEGDEEEEGDEETPDKQEAEGTPGNEETRGDVLDEITGQGRLF